MENIVKGFTSPDAFNDAAFEISAAIDDDRASNELQIDIIATKTIQKKKK